MKNRFVFVLLFIPIICYCQNGITIKIEDLKKPEELLWLYSYNNIYPNLISDDLGGYDKNSFSFNIIAKSKAPDSLVSFGYHSFFRGMYQAYADHRPFVLSPDMIWLLISQGFAEHVNANSEKLRHYFVNFSGKLSLIVSSEEITLNNPDSPWEKVFPEFTKQIGKYTGKELMEILSSNFSTTTPVEKVASEITIMEAMKPYFEFIVVTAVCGIPEVTLKGTTEDWQKVLDKTKALKKYELDWWIKEIEPILKEFVKASKGDINKRFWRNMFKYHSAKKYGAPNIVDGWIVKFFPYDKYGKRNKLKEIKQYDDLPNEIVKVNLKFIEIGKDTIISTPLELWAGFIGLEQNPENFALTPKIGWMIRKQGADKSTIQKNFESANNDTLYDKQGIFIRVKEIPEAIFEFKEIRSLKIIFTDNIIVPDRLAEIKIGELELYGKIKKDEIERIKTLFPRTILTINKETFNAP